MRYVFTIEKNSRTTGTNGTTLNTNPRVENEKQKEKHPVAHPSTTKQALIIFFNRWALVDEQAGRNR